ncbi:MBL fold metallo-hydrolase [Marinilabiliaceae bacterium ANBcel2]|nr:MBL fold metallo-hydrolase [Marinilabiliaceae bacterium ANBcel2]
MEVEICAIASGSNGNCYYIGNGKDAVLVDAGISRRKVLMRMKERNLDINKVRAVFISHEHADHCRGVRVLSNKLNVPVYMTQKSYESCRTVNRPNSYTSFVPGEAISVGGILIHTFLKNHDAVEPCSFRIEYKGVNVGVLTDIGSVCNNIISHISLCQALFLESNYDEDMLWDGPYPYHLKRRVTDGNGHLSNSEAFELLRQHHHFKLQIVFLSHLSAENNRPEIAKGTFKELEKHFRVKLTNRYAPSDVVSLGVDKKASVLV